MRIHAHAAGSQYGHNFQPVPLIARIKQAIERAKVKDPS